jgi:hypothetical protein
MSMRMYCRSHVHSQAVRVVHRASSRRLSRSGTRVDIVDAWNIRVMELVTISGLEMYATLRVM